LSVASQIARARIQKTIAIDFLGPVNLDRCLIRCCARVLA
jgi:hypothetical protein